MNAGFQLYRGTKVELTIKLDIHWKATAMATAAPRIVLGNISDISTQQIGPQLNMNEAEYTIMLITPTTPGRDGDTAVRVTPSAPSAMPREPMISRGLRPIFSTVNMATRVNVMLTTPIRTVWLIGLPMPMDSNILGA